MSSKATAPVPGGPDPRSPADDMRDLLYGDVPLTQWAAHDPAFGSVRDALALGDNAQARTALHAILATPDRSSRDYLQVWHQLRALGEVPDDPAHVYGVVVDMPVGAGLDTLAAYQDGTSRYLNHSGKILVWEASDGEVDALVRAVLEAGAAIAARIGPWHGPRPPLRAGLLRLSMLCAGGLYFGEGPVSALGADPMAGPLIAAATQLLQALTSKAVAQPDQSE